MCAESVGPGGLLILSGLLFAGGPRMRWRTVCVDVVLLAVLTGCPGTYGRGGAVDQAAREDLEERIDEKGCSLDDQREFCEGKEHSKECREKCG
jgi:hypothetical protein